MKIPPTAASILILVGSIVIGIAGVVLTAFVFDSMNWCCYHSWAMLHGNVTVVFLFWAFLGFHIVKFLTKARDQFAPIPNLAFVLSMLGTEYYTEFLMWPGLAVCGYGIYRILRRGDRATMGLMWSAVAVSVLNFASWLKYAIMFASYQG